MGALSPQIAAPLLGFVLTVDGCIDVQMGVCTYGVPFGICIARPHTRTAVEQKFARACVGTAMELEGEKTRQYPRART